MKSESFKLKAGHVVKIDQVTHGVNIEGPAIVVVLKDEVNEMSQEKDPVQNPVWLIAVKDNRPHAHTVHELDVEGYVNAFRDRDFDRFFVAETKMEIDDTGVVKKTAAVGATAEINISGTKELVTETLEKYRETKSN